MDPHEPLMTEIIWTDEKPDIQDLKKNKKSIRSLRLHDGYEMFQSFALFLQEELEMEVDEILEHLLSVHNLCTPLIYGHYYGLGSPNQNDSRRYQMMAAVRDMYD